MASGSSALYLNVTSSNVIPYPSGISGFSGSLSGFIDISSLKRKIASSTFMDSSPINIIFVRVVEIAGVNIT